MPDAVILSLFSSFTGSSTLPTEKPAVTGSHLFYTIIPFQLYALETIHIVNH